MKIRLKIAIISLALSASLAPPASAATTNFGDHVTMNGPGVLILIAPSGAVIFGGNPTSCLVTPCANGAAGIGPNHGADGTWQVIAQLTCCGGLPRFHWQIADWVMPTTPFLACAPFSTVHLFLDYDARTWSYTCVPG